MLCIGIVIHVPVAGLGSDDSKTDTVILLIYNIYKLSYYSSVMGRFYEEA